MVAGIKSERRPASNRNPRPECVGIRNIVEEFRREVLRHLSPEEPATRTLILQQAAEIAAARVNAKTDEELEELDDGISAKIDELLGHPIRMELDPQHGPQPVYDPGREEVARAFADVRYGHAIPLEMHHEKFIAWCGTKARTQGDDRRALKFLRTWCETNGVSPTLQAITKKVAALFRDEMHTVAPDRDYVTLNKYLHRLSRYWCWLMERQHVEVDVWAKLKRPAPYVVLDEDKERSFTDDEMRRLLAGPASLAMQDLMRIGALTGARLDVIVDLKVKHCAEGLFSFKPQKKETSRRDVPIHPALVPIVERRTAGKGADDDVFPEWPGPKKAGSVRERSFKTSNQFTEYRRRVGVEDLRPGKRRSLVNFHSFRRWFVTKAEQADQLENIIKAVVGHKRKGITLSRYSAGPLMEQARRCVEAVKLPAGV